VKGKTDRREIRSVCMPVPTIILNTPNTAKSPSQGLTHSRSAGDLDVVLNDKVDFDPCSDKQKKSKFSGSVSAGLHDPEQHSAVGLYCSPRLHRRSNVTSPTDGPPTRNSVTFVDSLNACSLNCLDTGSRVGSSVSLNSEYTSRSIGLISNDSNSESSQLGFTAGLMDVSYQRHSVLKRYYSSPEKDDDLLQHQLNVRRNSKSVGNMQSEDIHEYVSFDFGSDSTDDNTLFDRQRAHAEFCDIDNSLAVRTARVTEDECSNMNVTPDKPLVTCVTGGAALREGRIRKWLTEIRDPDENSNS